MSGRCAGTVAGFAAVFAVLLASPETRAGVVLGRSVVGTGGGSATGSGRIAVTTAGQPLAMPASGLARRICSGWWCVEEGAVTAVDGGTAAGVPELAFAAPFPNPATDALHLVFSLPRAATARLEVLDVTGRFVAMVTTGPFGPGRHTASWSGRGTDGSRVATGVYFVRFLVDGRSVASRRVSVMR